MKKLLLISAAATVICLPAAAQGFESPSFDNSASITQIGTANDASVNQAVGGLINGQGSAEVIQNGDDNEATVRQRSFTSPVSGAFDNRAKIDQRRDNGTATINQIHDYAASDTNEARILQVSDGAKAIARQRGDSNFINIRQLNASVAPDARVEQNGENNRATVRQRSDGGRVRIFQGDFEASAGASPQTFDSRATVRSDGINPFIRVDQYSVGHRTTVDEDGVNGRVRVFSDGYFNTQTVEQYSTDGLVEISTFTDSFDNVANVVQEGSDVGSEAFVTQEGEASDSQITQKDDFGGGGYNTASVSQTGLGFSLGDLSSTILQDGGDNSATVSQAADYAQSVINQIGISHVANVSQ